ncbi:hypothetical protein PPYR_04193 [Photinus pyralis]|uniref:C-type lectin domain-containing protein n=1 Tax=Photinus pyralis TaxID=7054 RepID=A0A1Y1KVJ4_PHOPY|nr:uncharacterized protein LOC116164821 isoform X2 [Photinus pyralis]KAB0802007.1 hypothetical protein PPYR_04193 [Photinus pyralis]
MDNSGTHFCLAFLYLTMYINCMEDGHEPSFVYLKKEYILLNYRVNWDEAQVICETYENGSLAITRNPAIRIFLAKCIEESAPHADSYWIGAERPKNSKIFHWIDDGEEFKDTYYFVLHSVDYVQPDARECLCFSRENHNEALYFNIDCRLRHALICERPYENKYDGSMTTTDWIVVNDRRYGIFYDQRTWSEAVRDCQKNHKAGLASFRNKNETRIVGKYLLMGRPSLENAWIGGRYKQNAWKFISNDVIISDHTDSNTLYPPWYLNRTTQRGGCLVLDRHIANEAVFIETSCNRRKSYICSKSISETPDKLSRFIDKIEYTLYYTKQTWDEAFETCLSQNGTLAKVTREVIHSLVQMMGEEDYEVYHVWIGGRLDERGMDFKWVEDNEIITKQTGGIDYYPPWYDVEFNTKYPCLNMDRENHNRPIFYGVDCSRAQEFICEQKSTRGHNHFGDADIFDEEIEARMF